MDTKNILRLDIDRIYKETESRSIDIAESVDPSGEMNDVIVICGADYEQLHHFLIRGTSEIADRANYVSCADETGLDAITAQCPPEYCCSDDLKEMPSFPKLKGELMDTSYTNQIIFNIPELQNIKLERHTIVQSYIKEAIISYLLAAWYELKAKPDLAVLYQSKFEKEVQKVKFNSVVNQKRLSSSRKYRYF